MTKTVAGGADWWSSMSTKEQTQYLENHPKSRMHKEALEDDEPEHLKDDNGDSERVEDVKKQIGYLKDDIREMVADGEDPARERAQLHALELELSRLTSKGDIDMVVGALTRLRNTR